MERWNEYREVVWYAPKRLPSRRWEQITPHQPANRFENEDYDEGRGRFGCGFAVL
jgi:hypothetical protein